MNELPSRPGRFRRWVLRPLAWSVTVLVVLLFLGERLADTEWARERARQLVVTRLAAALDRDVGLESLDFTLLPLGVEIRGLVVADPEDADEPLLVVPWASVEADLSTLTGRHVHLREVRVERPRVSLRFSEDSTNLPDFGGGGTGGGLELFIDHVRVDRAEILLDHRPAELSIRAREVRTRLEGTGEARLAGRVLAEAVRLRLPGTEAPLEVAVSARYEVGREGLEIRGSRISHPELDARIDGRCDWGDGEPRCNLDLRASLESRIAGDLGWTDELRGPLETEGNLQWRPSTFGFRARVSSPGLSLLGTTVDEVRGQLVLDRFGVRLQLDESKWNGGTLSGTGEVDLQDPTLPIDIELSLEEAVLDRILADREIPVDGAASRIGGTARLRFPARDPLLADGSVDLEIRSDPGLGGLPLDGRLSLRLEDGVLSTSAATLSAERQTILARGWVDLRRSTAEIDWEGRSLDVGELAELLPLDGSDQFWVPTAGTGRFEGQLRIRGNDLASDVRLQLDAVATPRLDLDRVVGSFVVDRESLEDLRLELELPEGALIVTGRIPFPTATSDARTRLVVDLVDTPYDAIRPWIPFDLPLDGPVDARVEVELIDETTSGRLTASMEPATVAGVPLRSLGARLEWSPESAVLPELTVLTEAGMLRAEGTVALTEGASSRLRVEAEGLRLDDEPFASRLPLEGLDGRLDLEAILEGSFARPDLTAEISVQSLRLEGETLGSGRGEVSLKWSDERVEIEGDLLDLVSFEGGGALPWPLRSETGEDPEPRPTTIDLRLTADDLSELGPLLPEGSPSLGGSFEGSLALRVEEAPAWSARLELTRLALVLDEHPMENLEPVAVSFDPEGIRLESLWMASPSGRDEIFLLGSIAGWTGSAPLDLRFQGALGASWIEAFVPQTRATGKLELLGRVAGTVEKPTFDGQGGVRNARLELEGDFPHAFQEVDGLVLFYPDSVVLDHLTGRFANGRATVEGSVDPRTVDYRLRVSGRDLELRILDGWLIDGDVDLAIRPLSGESGATVTGTARLDRLDYVEDVPIGMSQLLSSFLRRQRLEAGLAETPLASVHVNVAIEAPGAVAVRNNVADLDGSADLILRGTLAQPILFGRVDLEEGGRILYNDTEYQIQRGRITFANPRRIDPEVDLVATAEIREFDVTLILSGTTERLDADFTSDPPLPDLEVFRLLATGDVTRTDSSQSISAASFIYGQAASIIGQRVGNLFGFDQFRIDPLTGSGDNISAARVTVGKRISRDLYLTYSVDPASTEEQRLRIEWQISQGMKLVLTQNGDGTYEADVRWENRF